MFTPRTFRRIPEPRDRSSLLRDSLQDVLCPTHQTFANLPPLLIVTLFSFPCLSRRVCPSLSLSLSPSLSFSLSLSLSLSLACRLPLSRLLLAFASLPSRGASAVQVSRASDRLDTHGLSWPGKRVKQSKPTHTHEHTCIHSMHTYAYLHTHTGAYPGTRGSMYMRRVRR